MPNLNVSHSSISTVSGIEEQGQQDDKFGKQMENTYQLGENMTETDCTTFSLTNKLCIDKVLIRSPRYVLDFIVSSPNVQTANIAIQMHFPVPHPSSLTYMIKCLVFLLSLFFLHRRTLQTHPSFCCHGNPEGCTHDLPSRREIRSGVVSKNDKNNK